MQILGVEDAAAVEEHVCVNGCFCFPKLEASQWMHHKDDQCPECHEKRFKLVSAGPKRKPRCLPRNKFFYFGLQRAIGDLMFGDATWCQLRDSFSEEGFHGYMTSDEFCRLKEYLKHIPNVGLYELGFDFGNMFAFTSWSSGIILIRYVIICKTYTLSMCMLLILVCAVALLAIVLCALHV